MIRPLALLTGLALLPACTPTVQLAAPEKPIEFNVNVNITQEVRIKIDRELEQAFADDPALFGLAAGDSQ